MQAGDYRIRDTCDECHARKIRCVSAINGCVACHQYGRRCLYGRRMKMGRPRTRRRNTMEGNPPKRLAEAEAVDWDSHPNSLLAPVPQRDLECSKPTTRYDSWGDFAGHSSILQGENDWCSDFASMQANHQGVTHYPSPESNAPSIADPTSTSPYNYAGLTTHFSQRLDQSPYLPQKSSMTDQPEDAMIQKPSKLAFGTDTHDCTASNRLLDDYARLCNCQYDLQCRRTHFSAQLSNSTTMIAEVEKLDGTLQSVNDLCNIARDFLSKSAGREERSSDGASRFSDRAIILLTRNTITEALQLYSVIVQLVARKPQAKAAGLGPACACQRRDLAAGGPNTISDCSSTSNTLGPDEVDQITSTQFNGWTIGAFVPGPEMNQILLLSALDLHLSVFERFFHFLSQQPTARNTPSTPCEGNADTRHLRSKVQRLSETLRKEW